MYALKKREEWTFKMNHLSIPSKKCGLPIKEALKLEPDLKRYIIRDNQIDLGNTEALLLYNRTILRDFLSLDFTLPTGFLVPTICSRWSFVKWVLTRIQPKIVLEIGTGASAILALILARIGCQVEATEVNKVAFKSAYNNISLNGLKYKVKLIKTEKKRIIRCLYTSLEKFDAIICNPPQYNKKFYDQLYSSDRGFVGQESELVGGQNGHEFIIQLINEIDSYDSSVSCFFQITFPQITPLIRCYFQDNQYSFTEKTITLGTRQRQYYQVDF
ncbi:MAG: RlmF-related methyltransferase [Candidatus Hodarchaeota archaeon]